MISPRKDDAEFFFHKMGKVVNLTLIDVRFASFFKNLRSVGNLEFKGQIIEMRAFLLISKPETSTTCDALVSKYIIGVYNITKAKRAL